MHEQKILHIFDHRDYYNTLSGHITHGVPVYHAYKQRGGGAFSSIIRMVSKYAIPLLKRYILPHARNSLISTVQDLSTGTSTVKSSLKKNSKNLLNNVAGDIINSAQTGSGKRKVYYDLKND